MPNCSEATMRIDLTDLSKEEIKGIEDLLEKLTSGEDSQEWWYDTNWERADVFGKDIIEIKGETPYNCYDELVNYLSRLPYWDKVDYA
jgi:hypothetical protein